MEPSMFSLFTQLQAYDLVHCGSCNPPHNIKGYPISYRACSIICGTHPVRITGIYTAYRSGRRQDAIIITIVKLCVHSSSYLKVVRGSASPVFLNANILCGIMKLSKCMTHLGVCEPVSTCTCMYTVHLHMSAFIHIVK